MHRFPGKRYPRSFFRVFDLLKDKGPLNKNRKDDPHAFLGFLSFGTICNVVQCTVFPEKGTFCHFWGFFILLRNKGPLNEKSERCPTYIFRRSFIWDYLQRRAMHCFPGKMYHLSFLGFLINDFKGQESLNTSPGEGLKITRPGGGIFCPLLSRLPETLETRISSSSFLPSAP